MLKIRDGVDLKELENAPEWDGHTEYDIVERLFSLESKGDE